MNVEQQPQPHDRLKGLIPDHPLPNPLEDPKLTEEQKEALRRQTELLRRYGPPGASQQQVASIEATSDRSVMPNQVHAAMDGLSVPTSSRQATKDEVARRIERKGNVIFIGGDDDTDESTTRWRKGTAERTFLEWERKRAQKREKGA